MTTRLFLIRHAETTLSVEDRFAGSTDVLLSDRGREQVRGLAHRLATFRPAAIYASPMKRTVETAQILSAPHGLPVQTDARLREIDHGRWEGLTRKEVEAQFPMESGMWIADPYNFAPIGGETGRAVVERAVPAIKEIVAAHPNELIFAVSHKATIRLIIGYFLGIDLKGYRDRLDQRPACLNALVLYNRDSATNFTNFANPIQFVQFVALLKKAQSHRRDRRERGEHGGKLSALRELCG
ncbi:MAG: histidine phosphatase family protein [Chloroflexi bacterium]|nr:histidine phosphatase family protein [Chloroflexota bacterium]